MVFRMGGETTLYSSTVSSPVPQPAVVGFSSGYYLVTWSDGSTSYSTTTEVISPSGTVSSSQANDTVIIDYAALSNGYGSEAYVQTVNGQNSVVYGTWGPPPSGAYLLTQVVSPTADTLSGVSVSNGLSPGVSYYDVTNSTLYLELGSQSQGQQPIAVATGQAFGTQPSQLLSLSNGNYAIEWDTTSGPKLEILNSSGALLNTPNLPTSNVQDVVGLAAASNGGVAISETVSGQVDLWLMDGTSYALQQSLVSPVSESQDSHAQVAALSNGDFVVVWQNDASHTIEGQIVDSSGNKIGSSFQVNSNSNVSGGPFVSALGTDQFVVTWSDSTAQGSSVESQSFTLDAGTWVKIDNGSPIAISAGDFNNSGTAQLIASYSGTGTYSYSTGTGWVKIDNGTPNLMTTGDFSGSGQTQLIGVFPGYGTYTWTNATGWNHIDNGTPYVLTAGDYSGLGHSQLAGAFTGYGTYTWSAGVGWNKIDNGTPTLLTSGDYTGAGHAELGGVFKGYGTYTWTNATGWTKIDAGTPDQLVSGDFYNDGKSELAGYFAGYGTYIWSSSAGWTKIDTRVAGGLASVDLNGNGQNELLAYFPGSGVYEWQSGLGWSAYDNTSALPTSAQQALFATGNFQGGSVVDAAVTFPGQGGVWLDPPAGSTDSGAALLAQSIASSFAAPSAINSTPVSTGSTDPIAQASQLTLPHNV